MTAATENPAEAYRVGSQWRSEGRSRLWDEMRDVGSSAALARKIRVSPQRLHAWLTGKSQPNVRLAWRLERITEGRVPAASWGKAPRDRESSFVDGDTRTADPQQDHAQVQRR